MSLLSLTETGKIMFSWGNASSRTLKMQLGSFCVPMNSTGNTGHWPDAFEQILERIILNLQYNISVPKMSQIM